MNSHRMLAIEHFGLCPAYSQYPAKKESKSHYLLCALVATDVEEGRGEEALRRLPPTGHGSHVDGGQGDRLGVGGRHPLPVEENAPVATKVIKKYFVGALFLTLMASLKEIGNVPKS